VVVVVVVVVVGSNQEVWCACVVGIERRECMQELLRGGCWLAEVTQRV
jgi:hypothetical protein